MAVLAYIMTLRKSMRVNMRTKHYLFHVLGITPVNPLQMLALIKENCETPVSFLLAVIKRGLCCNSIFILFEKNATYVVYFVVPIQLFTNP